MKRATLAEELQHFSPAVWEYTDAFGNLKKAHKAVRIAGEQTIKFYTVRGLYARESWGGTVSSGFMDEVVTRRQWEKSRIQ